MQCACCPGRGRRESRVTSQETGPDSCHALPTTRKRLSSAWPVSSSTKPSKFSRTAPGHRENSTCWQSSWQRPLALAPDRGEPRSTPAHTGLRRPRWHRRRGRRDAVAKKQYRCSKTTVFEHLLRPAAASAPSRSARSTRSRRSTRSCSSSTCPRARSSLRAGWRTRHRGEVSRWHIDRVDRRLKCVRLFETAYHAGLHKGELLGLRWENLDLNTGTAAIRRTLQRTGTGGLTTQPTKTRAPDVASLSPPAASSPLKRHHEEQ